MAADATTDRRARGTRTAPRWGFAPWFPVLGVTGAAVVLFALSGAGLDHGDLRLIAIAIVAASAVPLVLSLVDRIVQTGAVINVAGVTLDFSRQVMESATTVQRNVGLPDHAQAGLYVNESSTATIAAALRDAPRHEAIVLDLGNGDEWWVTRLLALAAGATRAGCPRVFVFTGRDHGVDGAFLGWARPDEVMNAITAHEASYALLVARARRIAAFLVFADPSTGAVLATAPAPLFLPEATPYLDPKYTGLGDAAFEQILLNELIKEHEPTAASPATAPDRLSHARLSTLFSADLRRDTINLRASEPDQLRSVLTSRFPYVALVDNHRYIGLVNVATVERALIERLVGTREPPQA